MDVHLEATGTRVVGVDDRSSPEPDLGKVLRDWPDATAVIIVDNLGGRVFPTGLQRCRVPVVHYALDGPINMWWHRHYAYGCDLTLCDQKGPAEELAAAGHRALWLPVAVDPELYVGHSPVRPDYDLGFVGVINESVRPKRSRIVDFVSRKYRTKVAGGRREEWVSVEAAAAIYRRSKLVLNENLFPGVTTRTLEGMAAGRAVITEEGDGLADKFEPGREVITFRADNLADRIERYLKDDRARDKIAKAGRERCLAEHSLRRRAAEMIGHIQSLGEPMRAAPALTARHLGRAYLLAALRWPRRFSKRLMTRARLNLNRVADAAEDRAAVRIDLATFALHLGDVAGAESYLKAAEAEGGLMAGIYLGLMLLGTNHTAEAKGLITAAARRLQGPSAPEMILAALGDDLPSARLYTAIGVACREAGRGVSPGFMRRGAPYTVWTAAEWFGAALKFDPEHVEALRNLGEALAEVGAHTEAHGFFDRALALAPADQPLTAAWRRAGRMGYCFLQ